jgi:hypothetical protein
MDSSPQFVFRGFLGKRQPVTQVNKAFPRAYDREAGRLLSEAL